MDKIEKLSIKDVGRYVYYIPSHAKDDKSQWEKGKIKNFDNDRKVAWVVYHCADEWNTGWVNYTGACTDFNDLTFQK